MSRVQRTLWLLGGLTAVTLLFSSQLYVAYRAESVTMPFRAIFIMQIGHWYWWALAGPAAWSLAARWPLRAGQRVLTAQLQPHFLFNTLHTIGSLILQRNSDEAMRILAELGDLLRMTLDRQNVGLVTLREELEHLKRYLRIEETRFRDRLTVEWDVEPAALDWRVPPLILQPLIENALKHGVSARVEEGTLNVRAAVTGATLRVSIYNDGPSLPNTWSGVSSFGFGLRNVHERLATVGRGCSLTVENAGPQGVRATVELTHG